jgi:hypothetical protein
MKSFLLLTAPILVIYKLLISNIDAKQISIMPPLRLADTIQPELTQGTERIADSMLIDSLSDKIYYLKRVQKLNTEICKYE